MANKMNEVIDYILELPNTKDLWKDGMHPSIDTMRELSQVLYELHIMSSKANPNTTIPEYFDIETQMIKLARTIKYYGGHFADPIIIEPNGVVKDGAGFIYCGHSTKKYIIGEKLNKTKVQRLIKALRPTCKINLPIIMLSHVVSTKKRQEEYYYFTPIYHPFNNNGSYEYCCFKISNSTESRNSFKHYLCKELTNVYRFDYNWEYAAIRKNEANLPMKELTNLPMGSILVFNDMHLVKNTPIGASGFWKAHFGAIDI